jgi:CubicO group peptidase (beta-lactamase class C family)
MAMKMKLYALLVLWLALSTGTFAMAKEPAGAIPKADPASVGLDGTKLGKIADAMDAHVSAKEISGAVMLVVKDGKVAYEEAVGHCDIAAARPMKADTIFAIASMTKPITGTAVMILVDEGKLSLDDPISNFIPEFKNAKLKNGDALQREITVRDVVTHTSGLSGDQQNVGTIQETAKKLAERPLEFQPGEKWMYSPGLTVAGAVVEIVSKQPFDKFLEERLFAPLGMKDTTFNPSKQQHERIVKLYKKEGDKLQETSHWINDFSKHREPNPSGGLFSTAADQGAFYAMVLAGGELNGKRILSEKATKELTKIHSGETKTGFTPGNGWGIGWCVVQEPQGPTQHLGKGSAGHGGAFGTQGWMDPTKNMAFVLMIQRSGLANGDASPMRQDLQRIAVESIKK